MRDRKRNYVIIIGAARSGTKLLRDILGKIPTAAVVPYDINFIWRHGNQKHPNDCLSADEYSETVGNYIRSKIDALALAKQAHEAETCIEKTVSNTLRISFVNKVFPQAVFLHLIRDGRDVVESAYRQWLARPDLGYLLGKLRVFYWNDPGYALWYLGNVAKGIVGGAGRRSRIWGPRYDGIERDLEQFSVASVCGLQWRTCVEYSLAGLQDIEPDRVFTLRYEDFVHSAVPLTNLLQFLGIVEQAPVKEEFHRIVRPVAQDLWKSTFTDEQWRSLCDIIEPTRKRLGYE